MRYTEIDGKKYKIEKCEDCPFFDEDGGVICPPVCRHPSFSKLTRLSMNVFYDGGFDEKCPLRKVE